MEKMIYMTADEAWKLLCKAKDDPDFDLIFGIQIVPKKDYLTTNEVIKLLNCGRTHVNGLISSGKIKKIRKVAGKHRFDRKEIEQLLNQGLV